MWVCSKLGFFSIVKKGKPEAWQVRARRKNDLQELLESTGLEEPEIVSTPDHDYGFRIIVDREGLESVFACLAESIDYPNFKNCIACLPAQRDKLPAYHQFWDGMLKVQKAAPDHDDSQRTEARARPMAKSVTSSTTTIKPETKARTAEDIVVQEIGWLKRMLKVISEFRAEQGHWPTRLRWPSHNGASDRMDERSGFLMRARVCPTAAVHRRRGRSPE
jgi:hypothetical protein